MGSLIERKKKIMMMQTILLPPGYRQVEYIGATKGTGQYIDTGIVLPNYENCNIVCKGKFKFTDLVYWEAAFGCKGSTFCLQRYNNTNINLSAQSYGAVNSNVYVATEGQEIEFELSKQNVVINGSETTIEHGSTYYAGNTIWVFGKMAAGSSAIDVKGSCIFYYFQMFENDNLIRNYIPCVRKSDDKPGMYDTVSKTFFTNAGTGEFIVPQ